LSIGSVKISSVSKDGNFGDIAWRNEQIAALLHDGHEPASVNIAVINF
jgi:hypothetical protein